MANLSSLRYRAGLTQKDVAKLMHVSESTIGKWERRESKIDYNDLIDLLIIYGITETRTQRRFADEYFREDRRREPSSSAHWDEPPPRQQEGLSDELIEAWKELMITKNAFIKASNHFDRLVSKSGISEAQILDELFGKT